MGTIVFFYILHNVFKKNVLNKTTLKKFVNKNHISTVKYWEL